MLITLKRWFFLVTRHWGLLFAAIVAGAIVHILATLSASRSGDALSYRLLARALPANDVVVAKPISAKFQPLPFMTTHARYAFCRFDANQRLVRLKARLPGTGWSLSLHAPNGDNFYFVGGIDDRPLDIDVVLEPPGGLLFGDPITISRGKKRIPKVSLPNTQGIAIFKGPIKGLAFRRRVDELLSSFRCFAVRDNAA